MKLAETLKEFIETSSEIRNFRTIQPMAYYSQQIQKRLLTASGFCNSGAKLLNNACFGAFFRCLYPQSVKIKQMLTRAISAGGLHRRIYVGVD
ncbi:MAG TPA: hypothetical protein VNB22_18730 [Pyrinomonadaceae bacterium]|nr:hypothetical protein [Pyrinomonadaceae bacterium]